MTMVTPTPGGKAFTHIDPVIFFCNVFLHNHLFSWLDFCRHLRHRNFFGWLQEMISLGFEIISKRQGILRKGNCLCCLFLVCLFIHMLPCIYMTEFCLIQSLISCNCPVFRHISELFSVAAVLSPAAFRTAQAAGVHS